MLVLALLFSETEVKVKGEDKVKVGFRMVIDNRIYDEFRVKSLIRWQSQVLTRKPGCAVTCAGHDFFEVDHVFVPQLLQDLDFAKGSDGELRERRKGTEFLKRVYA